MVTQDPPPTPPPSPVGGAGGPHVLPTNRIICERTVDKAWERIPFNDLLEKPSDNERWACCVVKVDEFKARWSRIRNYPGIHVVGLTADRKYQQVSLSETRIKWLQDYVFSFEFDPASPYDVSQPSDGEIAVHGKAEAKRKAENRVIQSAGRAIEFGHGKGLDFYLRHNTPNERVRTAIEWLLLRRDIKETGAPVLGSFLLRLGGESDGEPTQESMKRGREKFEDLVELCTEKAGRLLYDIDSELQEVALLRGVVEATRNRTDALQYGFNSWWSANANRARLGDLLGLDLTWLVSPDDKRVGKGLRQGKENCDNTMEELRIRVLWYVPVGYLTEERSSLPSDLVNGVGYGIVRNALNFKESIYFMAPWLRKSENDMAVFLCYCANLPTIDRAFCEWASSEEGAWFYEQTVATLAEKNNTPEQAILRLSALVWLDRLLPCGPEEVSVPIHDCFLEDFARLLDGQQLKNRRAVWQRMVWSVLRAVGESCSPIICHFVGWGTKMEPHVLDGISDRYWHHILCQGNGHEEALRESRRVLEDTMSQLSRRSGTSEDNGWELVE